MEPSLATCDPGPRRAVQSMAPTPSPCTCFLGARSAQARGLAQGLLAAAGGGAVAPAAPGPRTVQQQQVMAEP